MTTIERSAPPVLQVRNSKLLNSNSELQAPATFKKMKICQSVVLIHITDLLFVFYQYPFSVTFCNHFCMLTFILFLITYYFEECSI